MPRGSRALDGVVAGAGNESSRLGAARRDTVRDPPPLRTHTVLAPPPGGTGGHTPRRPPPPPRPPPVLARSLGARGGSTPACHARDGRARSARAGLRAHRRARGKP